MSSYEKLHRSNSIGFFVRIRRKIKYAPWNLIYIDIFVMNSCEKCNCEFRCSYFHVPFSGAICSSRSLRIALSLPPFSFATRLISFEFFPLNYQQISRNVFPTRRRACRISDLIFSHEFNREKIYGVRGIVEKQLRENKDETNDVRIIVGRSTRFSKTFQRECDT